MDSNWKSSDEYFSKRRLTILFHESICEIYQSSLIKLFKPITPSFIIGPLVPLYVAWFFYMIRFYLMPWILGYSVMGMLSFPLESEISRQIYQFFNSF